MVEVNLFCFNSGEDNIQDKNMTELKMSLRTITEQTEFLQSNIKIREIAFNDSITEYKEMRDTSAINESVEVSFNGFDMS